MRAKVARRVNIIFMGKLLLPLQIQILFQTKLGKIYTRAPICSSSVHTYYTHDPAETLIEGHYYPYYYVSVASSKVIYSDE